MQPTCGMWLIHGTVTTKSNDDYSTSRGFPTFYLHPEVQGIVSAEHAVKIATGILNPTNTPNVIPNISAVLVTVESIT